MHFLISSIVFGPRNLPGVVCFQSFRYKFQRLNKKAPVETEAGNSLLTLKCTREKSNLCRINECVRMYIMKGCTGYLNGNL